jgi:UDP-sugar transporter A1/2/3
LTQPTICGLPLKYVSLLTLALQNAALSIVMHYSRVSIHPDLAYSPATAVLLNELLKGSISFIIAFVASPHFRNPRASAISQVPIALYTLFFAIFSPDSWKLSIPAILYVVQNSLQFVAISNLPVATFQVTYQMKILTTAAFSVILLRKKLSGIKWLALFFLAIGVAIVQLQTTAGIHKLPSPSSATVGSAQEYYHRMSPLKGFGAVTAACFTSGLAGVYFEMVLKGSKTDLWVRNVQLSLFSLIPALLPILYAPSRSPHGFISSLFHNFGPWAWATVCIQVLGGLLTAVVIKYSDNILKGFATSLSIVLSFLASVILFEFKITMGFLIGAVTVLASTWMYNQPAAENPPSPVVEKVAAAVVDTKREYKFSLFTEKDTLSISGRSTPSSRSYPSTPVIQTVFPNQTSNNNSSGSVLSSLGVGSFMRRKPSSGLPPPYSTPHTPTAYSPKSPTYTPAYTPSAPPSRTSSTANLLNLVSLSRSASVLGLGEKDNNPMSSMMMELGGTAENGEVVHEVGEMEGRSANGSPVGFRSGGMSMGVECGVCVGQGGGVLLEVKERLLFLFSFAARGRFLVKIDDVMDQHLERSHRQSASMTIFDSNVTLMRKQSWSKIDVKRLMPWICDCRSSFVAMEQTVETMMRGRRQNLCGRV